MTDILQEWWEVKRTHVATGEVDWRAHGRWSDVLGSGAQFLTHNEADECAARDRRAYRPGFYRIAVVHVIRRKRGAARREALDEVRGYLAQCDDLKVYVADVVDEIDRLAKEQANGS